MKNNLFERLRGKEILTTLALLIILVGAYQIWFLYKNKTTLENKVLDLENSLKTTTEGLEQVISLNTSLNSELVAEKEVNSNFSNQIGDISSVVGDLEKLSKTDSELLQKYSKVFFLNEHYSPPRFKTIDSIYVENPDQTQQVHANIWPDLKKMFEDAKDDGINLLVISAYRSFYTQATLKQGYTVTYGAGTANQFSADQGYSEHQLGTTLDFTTRELGKAFTNFESTEAYKWLQNNAYKYGFTLSYPKDNKFYIFEPWHWRFVGKDLARDLHRKGELFYDLDQREINKYLVDFFD